MTDISSLSTDTLSVIFFAMSGKDVFKVARTCKTWHSISQSDVFWKQAIKKHAPGLYSTFSQCDPPNMHRRINWVQIGKIWALQNEINVIKQEQETTSNLFNLSLLGFALSLVPLMWNTALKVRDVVSDFYQFMDERAIKIMEERVEKLRLKYPTLTREIAKAICRSRWHDVDVIVQVLKKFPDQEAKIIDYIMNYWGDCLYSSA